MAKKKAKSSGDQSHPSKNAPARMYILNDIPAELFLEAMKNSTVKSQRRKGN